MVEKPYRDPEKSGSKLRWVVFSAFERIQKAFGYSLWDKEIIDFALENWNKGDVIVNYSKEGQKYILAVEPCDKKLMFITDNLPHHINIKHKYVPDWLCLWWWRITIDDKNKTISLYWKSKVYGEIHWKAKGAIIKMLEENYPNYKILFKK